jgi:hypothetical protein
VTHERNGAFEWLRLITPILLALSLLIVNDIRSNLIKLETKFDRFVEMTSTQNMDFQARLSKLEAKWSNPYEKSYDKKGIVY